MKNKINIVFVILLVIFTLGGVLIGRQSKVTDVYENGETNIKKNKNMLSMMLETEAESGNYEMTTRESWPTSGYKFNSELSKCENGSELSWDDESKTVLMSGNVSDKCYVYFDKQFYPIKANVSSVRPNSFVVNVKSDSDDDTLDTYNKFYYSIDNGNTFVSSSANSYKFSNLTEISTYNIVVYAVDSENSKSNTYSFNVTNDFYSDATFVSNSNYSFDDGYFNPTFELDGLSLDFFNIKFGGNCILDFMGGSVSNLFENVEINASFQNNLDDYLVFKNVNFIDLSSKSFVFKANVGNIKLESVGIQNAVGTVFEFQLSENGNLILDGVLVDDCYNVTFKISGSSKYIGKNVNSIDDLPNVTKEFFKNTLNNSDFSETNTNLIFMIGDFSVSLEDLKDYNW